jgi:hypothetical protein
MPIYLLLANACLVLLLGKFIEQACISSSIQPSSTTFTCIIHHEESKILKLCSQITWQPNSEFGDLTRLNTYGEPGVLDKSPLNPNFVEPSPSGTTTEAELPTHSMNPGIWPSLRPLAFMLILWTKHKGINNSLHHITTWISKPRLHSPNGDNGKYIKEGTPPPRE